jgi:RHS repeat-associated protein
MIDNLTLTHYGNQLTKVTDNGNDGLYYGDEEYLVNKVNRGNCRVYDANGNSLYDTNSDIWGIRYNLLNLPDSIQFYQGHQTLYSYSAAGTKLQVVDKTAPGGVTIPVTNLDTVLTTPLVLSTITTDYIGDAIYRNDTLLRILLPTGYYQGGVYYYYLKDHLGSNRVVLNSSGTVVESSDYYPSGMRFGESVVNGGNVQPYRHTGMEMQGMHGLNWIDNKARMRSVNVPEFTTMDPLAEKYPWQSPYCYAGNDPINAIDINGDSIWISYNDANGQQQRMLYTQGMEYKGNDSFISSVVNNLNKMSSVDIGKTVLDKLTGSQSNYNFTNTFAKDKNSNIVNNALSFDDKTGEIHAGVLVNNPTMLEGQKIESTGHELFHAYQTEFGETGATINREVGAYIFGRALATNLGYGTLGYGNFTPTGQIYENAMTTLSLSPTFNQQAYNTAINTFSQGSTVNINGTYDRFIIRPNDINPVIKGLYPLVK